MGNSTVTKISASEAERTQKEIHALLKQYPELGVNQEYVAALAELPSGIIVRARKYDPITAKAVLSKALNWKDQLWPHTRTWPSGRRSSPWPWRPRRNI